MDRKDQRKLVDDIKKASDCGQIKIPENFIVENAVKSAFIVLEEVTDRNRKPALAVCTRDSIRKAIFSMVIQSLNPLKKQCYFVVRGQTLHVVRSYMGAIVTAKMVDRRIMDVRADVVYKGDDFVFEMVNGVKRIKKHSQTMESMSSSEIIGAYALAASEKEAQLHVDIMTIEEIKTSWKQSKKRVIVGGDEIKHDSTHGLFTGEMARRTVINRLCKKIINTSDDTDLLFVADKADEERSIEQDIKESANQTELPFPNDGQPPTSLYNGSDDKPNDINDLPEEKPEKVEKEEKQEEKANDIEDLEDAPDWA